jgi:GNAT superfamily N-acetyltransferase
MPYEFVRYRPEMRSAALSLLTYRWGSDARLNAAYFQWKYETNPHAPDPLVYVALDRGDLIAVLGFMGARWRTASTEQAWAAPVAADLVIHPGHRNRGLFRRIMAFALADLRTGDSQFVLGLTGMRYAQFSLRRMGWRFAGDLGAMRVAPRWGLPDAGLAATRIALDRTLGSEFYPFGSFRDGRRSRRAPDVIVQRDPDSERMASLVAAVRGDDRIRALKGEPYFAWRFRNPRSIYRFLWCYDGGNPVGYAALRAARRPRDRKAAIVDVAAISDAVRKKLISAALELRGIAFWNVWAGTLDGSTRQFLHDAGFRPTETHDRHGRTTTHHLLVASLNQGESERARTVGGNDPGSLANWDLSMLDSDVF